jgi:hypothetical protein
VEPWDAEALYPETDRASPSVTVEGIAFAAIGVETMRRQKAQEGMVGQPGIKRAR